jgi:hypothetical protein
MISLLAALSQNIWDVVSSMPACAGRAKPKTANFRPMLGAHGLWAGRDLYLATPALTWDLDFSGLIRMTALLGSLLRHTRGCGGTGARLSDNRIKIRSSIRSFVFICQILTFGINTSSGKINCISLIHQQIISIKSTAKIRLFRRFKKSVFSVHRKK